MHLKPFQNRFIKSSLRPGIDTVVCSLPRGNGKSFLAALLAKRSIDPSDSLFRPGTESLLFAASLNQARRTVYAQLLSMVDHSKYRIANSANHCHILHTDTNTKLSVLPCNAKTAQGLGVNNPCVFVDEPGAMETLAGEMLNDALTTAQGKPGADMRVWYFGTLAPNPSQWWVDLALGGSDPSTYCYTLQANPKRWSDLREIRRVNPLMYAFPESRKTLKSELDKALSDSRLAARFKSYRLNLPTAEESTMLLQVEDWQRVCQRRVPPRESQPVVGLDCGQGRAWSSAVAVYPNGRTECRAIAPGVPDIAVQERRDRVSSGTYQRLIDVGVLRIAHGRRVPLVSDLVELAADWNPAAFIADHFRLNEVRDAAPSKPIITRRTLWSEASEDIRGCRRLCLDGNISVSDESKGLLQHSLSVAKVENDDAGNSRLVKKKRDNSTRDDVACAFVLAAGVMSRARGPKPLRYAVAR